MLEITARAVTYTGKAQRVSKTHLLTQSTMDWLKVPRFWLLFLFGAFRYMQLSVPIPLLVNTNELYRNLLTLMFEIFFPLQSRKHILARKFHKSSHFNGSRYRHSITVSAIKSLKCLFLTKLNVISQSRPIKLLGWQKHWNDSFLYIGTVIRYTLDYSAFSK